MRKDTVFITMCKSLERASKESMESEVALVRKKVKEYVNGDKDKYIQLKAEVDFESNITDSFGYVFSLLGFAVAALAFLYSVASEFDKIATAIVVTSALLGELILAVIAVRRLGLINKWRRYIVTVINEFNPDQSAGKIMSVINKEKE